MTQAWVYNHIERPLPPIIHRMERAGMMVDVARLHDLQEQLVVRAATLRAGALSGLNPASHPQVRNVLYEDLRLPRPRRRTATGLVPTDEEALRWLLTVAEGDARGFITALLEYREVAKMEGTYAAGLLKAVATDGCIHCQLHQVGAETGRMSSSNPNLQNIPVRSPEWGPAFRSCFAAPPGRVLVVADYSQVELRVMAAFSRDPVLVGAFQRGEDVHGTVTAILGLPPDQRYKGKTLNFGIGYGMAAPRLATELAIPMAEAEDLVAAYWRRLPDLHQWVRNLRARVIEDGYVETWFGRRNYYPLPATMARWQREKVLREVGNMPIQGTAADIMKLFLIAADPVCAARGADPIMVVHDELVVEVDESSAEMLLWELVETAETVTDIGVPVVMDAHQGRNWQEAKTA